jgi:hypothetical protein
MRQKLTEKQKEIIVEFCKRLIEIPTTKRVLAIEDSFGDERIYIFTDLDSLASSKVKEYYRLESKFMDRYDENFNIEIFLKGDIEEHGGIDCLIGSDHGCVIFDSVGERYLVAVEEYFEKFLKDFINKQNEESEYEFKLKCIKSEIENMKHMDTVLIQHKLNKNIYYHITKEYKIVYNYHVAYIINEYQFKWIHHLIEYKCANVQYLLKMFNIDEFDYIFK